MILSSTLEKKEGEKTELFVNKGWYYCSIERGILINMGDDDDADEQNRPWGSWHESRGAGSCQGGVYGKETDNNVYEKKVVAKPNHSLPWNDRVGVKIEGSLFLSTARVPARNI